MQRFDLDDLDRTIIGLLTVDGRLSASEIASKIGTASERTIRNRITALNATMERAAGKSCAGGGSDRH